MVKVSFLMCKRRPFATKKGVFYNTIHKLLII